MPAFIERMVLAHELTHALDDQYGDLRTLTERTDRTEDMDLVVTCLAEGSATALMLQHMVRAQAAGRVDAGQLMQYVAQEMERAKVFEQLPRYFSAMFGSYIVGAAFLAAGDIGAVLTMPDNRVIGERFLSARRALPGSSEQVLHPAKYWDAAKKDEPVVVDDAAAEKWLRQPGSLDRPPRHDWRAADGSADAAARRVSGACATAGSRRVDERGRVGLGRGSLLPLRGRRHRRGGAAFAEGPQGRVDHGVGHPRRPRRVRGRP